MVINISEKEKVCANCKYFKQHYIFNEGNFNDYIFTKDGRKLVPINQGHCFCTGIRKRSCKATDTACYRFEEEDNDNL